MRRTGACAAKRRAPAAPGSKGGYILSLVVLMLLSVLAIYANDAAAQKQQARTLLQRQFYTEKAVFFIDDMAQDMRNILSLDDPSNSTQLVFREDMSINKSSFLAGYSNFIGDFSKDVNVNVSFSYSDPLSISVSNGLVYVSNFTNQQIDVYNSSGGPAAVTAYYVSINSSQERNALSPISFIANGMYVLINYTDLAKPMKSFVASGFVDPTVLNTYEIKFGGGRSVFLHFGLVDGRQNAYRMQQVAITTLIRHALAVNTTKQGGLYATYGLPVNVSLPGVDFIGSLPAN